MSTKKNLPNSLSKFLDKTERGLQLRKINTEQELENINDLCRDFLKSKKDLEHRFFAEYSENCWIERPYTCDFELTKLSFFAEDFHINTLYTLTYTPCRVAINKKQSQVYSWAYCIGSRADNRDFYDLYKTKNIDLHTIKGLFGSIQHQVQRSRDIFNYVKQCNDLGEPLCQEKLKQLADFEILPTDVQF